jgi:hypothetical protein
MLTIHRILFKASVTLIAVTAIIAILCGSHAQAAGSLAEKFRIDPVYQIKEPIDLPVSGKYFRKTIEFPSVPVQPGKVLCLRFKAHYPMEHPSDKWVGNNLIIDFNGKWAGKSMPDGSERILNRRDTTKTARNVSGWFQGDRMEVMWGPAGEVPDARLTADRDEGYWYVLNVSDVAEFIKKDVDDRVVGGHPNKIILTSTVTDESPNPSPAEMRIEDFTIGYASREDIEKIQPVTLVSAPAIKGKTLVGIGCSLNIASNGAMELDYGKDRYTIRSAFSYPSDTIKYHQFTWESTDDTDWKADFLPGEPGNVTVKGESANYSVTRRIQPKDGKFLVFDTIQNKANGVLGMSIHNQIITPGRLAADDVYISGVPGIADFKSSAYNPTLFVKQKGSSLAVAVSDNVFENQLSMSRKPNMAQFGTEHFGMAPGASYTMEWAIYPSADRDYWSFINLLRREWNVNFTVLGPRTTQMREEDWIGKRQDRKILMFMGDLWFHFMDGAGLTDEEYGARLKAQIDKVTKVNPTAIVMPKLETPNITILRKNLPGSELIPKTPKQMPFELTAAQSEVLKKTPWWDSMMKTADGRGLIDTWYTDDDAGEIDLMVYPMLGNSKYKSMIDMIDSCMDKVGCKGIYMDMFEYDEEVGAGPRTDYGRWDGHTVDLTSQGDVARKFTDMALASLPARVAIMKHIYDKGGIATTNGHPSSRDLRSIPYMSACEADYEVAADFQGLQNLMDPSEPGIYPRMSMGHLCSPVTQGLGLWRPDLYQSGPAAKEFAANNRAELIQKYVIVCLRNAQLFYEYANIPDSGPGKGEYGIVRYMFPFTPVELHAGYMIGKERILTAISGTFKWDHAEKAVCLTFDTKGYKTTPNVSMVKKGQSWDVTVKLKDWNATAVIMSPSELK